MHAEFTVCEGFCFSSGCDNDQDVQYNRQKALSHVIAVQHFKCQTRNIYLFYMTLHAEMLLKFMGFKWHTREQLGIKRRQKVSKDTCASERSSQYRPTLPNRLRTQCSVFYNCNTVSCGSAQSIDRYLFIILLKVRGRFHSTLHLITDRLKSDRSALK